MSYPDNTIMIGEWCDYTGEETVRASVLSAMNGGDADWFRRMEEAGVVDIIESEYRDAIQEAMPAGMKLLADAVYGNFEDDWSDPRDAISAVDLDSIIDSHADDVER